MSEEYVLYDAVYDAGRVTATYASQSYRGEGYEGDAVHEIDTDLHGNPSNTEKVVFYARRIVVKDNESGSNYEGGGNYNKDALEKASRSSGPLETEDLELFDQKLAQRDIETFVRSQAGGVLEIVESEDVRLHFSEVVNNKQIEVTFVPQ